jgi:protein-tyrosine phosphatase
MLDVLDDRADGTADRAGTVDGGNPLSANTTFWRGLPARAASVRHLSLPADSAENDIIDPYRRGPEVYRQMEDELAPAIISVLRHARLNLPA